MPVPVPEALAEAAAAAAAKAAAVRSLPRYLLSAALAGAYVGIAVVLLLSVAGPLAAAGSPATRLVQGSVFGIALTLVVFAGAELFTGNAMVLLQGWWARSVRPVEVAAVWAASLVGNLVGSVLLALLVHGAGTLRGSPAGALLAQTVGAKAALAGPQLLWRSLLCNLLVCLGLWMAARTRSDVAKLGVLWWALLAFIASGFEHSVANMTIFALGALDGTATVGQLLTNLAWTVPGNVLGGGLVVGLGYAWLGGRRATLDAQEPTPAAVPVHAGPSSGVLDLAPAD